MTCDQTSRSSPLRVAAEDAIDSVLVEVRWPFITVGPIYMSIAILFVISPDVYVFIRARKTHCTLIHINVIYRERRGRRCTYITRSRTIMLSVEKKKRYDVMRSTTRYNSQSYAIEAFNWRSQIFKCDNETCVSSLKI